MPLHILQQAVGGRGFYCWAVFLTRTAPPGALGKKSSQLPGRGRGWEATGHLLADGKGNGPRWTLPCLPQGNSPELINRGAVDISKNFFFRRCGVGFPVPTERKIQQWGPQMQIKGGNCPTDKRPVLLDGEERGWVQHRSGAWDLRCRSSRLQPVQGGGLNQGSTGSLKAS